MHVTVENSTSTIELYIRHCLTLSSLRSPTLSGCKERNLHEYKQRGGDRGPAPRTCPQDPCRPAPRYIRCPTPEE